MARSTAYLLLPLALLGFSALVGAVDIIFYESTNGCGGSGYSFNSIGGQICCEVSASDGGSVLVTSADSCTASLFYRNGGCSSQVGSGSGNYCLEGGQFTGAYWYSKCRRRSLLGDDESAPACKGKMNPNGIVFTEDPNKGSWVLKSDNPSDLLRQLKKLSDAEKGGWIESQGGSFQPRKY